MNRQFNAVECRLGCPIIAGLERLLELLAAIPEANEEDAGLLSEVGHFLLRVVQGHVVDVKRAGTIQPVCHTVLHFAL